MGGAIISLPVRSTSSTALPDRARIDDVAAAPGDHLRQRGMGQGDKADDVGVHRRAQVVERRVLGPAVALESRPHPPRAILTKRPLCGTKHAGWPGCSVVFADCAPIDMAYCLFSMRGELDLKNRACIVTGASSGIGLGIARMLATEGYGLTMVARDQAKLDRAMGEMGGDGTRIATFSADLSDENAAKEVVHFHAGRFGRLDVLVNSAGVGVGRPLDKITARQFDLQMHLNVRAMALLYREAADLLKAAGAEHRNANVINLSSISGKTGAANFSFYSASKFAVVGFTQSMNRELGPLGIKSTVLCPYLTDTPMSEFIQDRIPADTMIQVDDVVSACRMLLQLSPGCLIPEITFTQPHGRMELE